VNKWVATGVVLLLVGAQAVRGAGPYGSSADLNDGISKATDDAISKDDELGEGKSLNINYLIKSVESKKAAGANAKSGNCSATANQGGVIVENAKGNVNVVNVNKSFGKQENIALSKGVGCK
jgi:hypothetical protein